VEVLVLGQVRRLLASPELVARAITAVIEALGALEPVWDELYPAEQARILQLLIERIDVAPDGISVRLHAAGLRSLVVELADQEAAALAAFEPLLEAAE
jgi:site-specific DNA recombinase